MQRNKHKKEYFEGCLIGGAIGDALGYPVEFLSYSQIQKTYGEHGICKFDLNKSGVAEISDDTQMTLFTANGILLGDTRRKMRGIGGFPPADYVRMAYKDWYYTQTHPKSTYKGVSWLTSVDALYNTRYPGNTCMASLASKNYYSIAQPANNSKGCGGVMRVAPYGLFYGWIPDRKLFLKEAAEIGAITHGHDMSHLSCAYIADIIGQIIYFCRDKDSIETIAKRALADVDLCGFSHKTEFETIINTAITLAHNEQSDFSNISQLGEGWTAEEAAAIAIYSAIKHQNNPLEGIAAAVNHNGDSDSTGAIAGNILGAWHGISAFPKAYTTSLELASTILEIADDLAKGCPMSEYSSHYDSQWVKKYIEYANPYE